MEFSEWVVSGLDQLRLGQLPAGNGFYEAASAGLGGDTRLADYMNSGDAAKRAELVQLIAAAVAANPGFEQQLRAAAATAQGTGSAGAAGGRPPFLKTTNGLLAMVAAAVVVVGGGVGLAVALGGSGGDLAGIMKGTWTCTGKPSGDSSRGVDPVSLTVGDGTWSAGNASGTWKQDGGGATLHDSSDPENDLRATNLPGGTGSFDISLGSVKDKSQLMSLHIKGTLATHKITLVVPGDNGDLSLTCTK